MSFYRFYENYAEKAFLQVNSKKVNSLAFKFLKSPVLDLGCFLGEKTHNFSKHFDVDGCDISDTAINKAKEKYKNLNFFRCDFTKKNIKTPRKYNSIYCSEVIEHVFETDIFLKNCYNKLNDGGILVLTTPNVTSLLNRMRLLLGDEKGILGGDGHIKFFKPSTIKKELEKSGFKVLKMTGYNVRPFTTNLAMPLNFCEGTIAISKKHS